MNLKDKLEELKEKGLEEIKNADDSKKINEIRVNLLGKKGPITEVLRGMRDLSAEERPKVGSFANAIKEELATAIAEKCEEIEIERTAKQLEKKKSTLRCQVSLLRKVSLTF